MYRLHRKSQNVVQCPQCLPQTTPRLRFSKQLSANLSFVIILPSIRIEIVLTALLFLLLFKNILKEVGNIEQIQDVFFAQNGLLWFYERDYVQLVPIEEKKCQSYIVDQKSMQFFVI